MGPLYSPKFLSRRRNLLGRKLSKIKAKQIVLNVSGSNKTKLPDMQSTEAPNLPSRVRINGHRAQNKGRKVKQSSFIQLSCHQNYRKHKAVLRQNLDTEC